MENFKLPDDQSWGVPIKETHFFLWLDSAENYNPSYLLMLRLYLKDLGFKIGKDKLHEKQTDLLRYIFKYHFHNKKV